MPKLQNKHEILGKNMLKSHPSTEKQHKKRKHYCLLFTVYVDTVYYYELHQFFLFFLKSH